MTKTELAKRIENLLDCDSNDIVEEIFKLTKQIEVDIENKEESFKTSNERIDILKNAI